MHPIYLPFTEELLSTHFTEVKKRSKCTKDKHLKLKYYTRSVERYSEYLSKNPNRKGRPISEMKKPCQIEKDERFWLTSTMMTIFYSKNRIQEFVKLFRTAYGEYPPIEGMKWDDCFSKDLHLFFEVTLPSPASYKKWLRKEIEKVHLIPYIVDSAFGKSNLEGTTKIDALLLNSKNGFAVVIEAKVLSDISYETTYNTMRNQIARNIDVMLERNHQLCYPLNKRDPEKTLFLLITPKMFKNNPSSRLYGYKFLEYKNNPESLERDLQHRKGLDWQIVSKRLGWLTWEDFREVNKNCCPWLDE
jgi:hypothetical protein